MPTIQNWSDITLYSLQKLWEGFLHFIPAFLAAIIFFIIGWFISIIIGKLLTEILRKIKFNQILERGSWDEALAKADIKVDVSEFVGAVVKWVLVIFFLQVSVGILGWIQFSVLLGQVVSYLPNVVVAVMIFVVTVIIADILEKVVRVSVERTKVGYGHIASAIVKWAVWIFAIVIILDQLNVGGILPQAIIFGIIGFFSIAGGLAFGLGGKEAAAEIIKNFRGKMSQK
jgi:hypothetical protein